MPEPSDPRRDDRARLHALQQQGAVKARVGDIGALSRAAGAAAIAAIAHHVDAPALRHESLDARGTVGKAAGVAVEIEDGRLARPCLAVPGDETRPVGRIEHALVHADEPRLRGQRVRAIREIHKPALAQVGGKPGAARRRTARRGRSSTGATSPPSRLGRGRGQASVANAAPRRHSRQAKRRAGIQRQTPLLQVRAGFPPTRSALAGMTDHWMLASTTSRSTRVGGIHWSSVP
jgi:hypothetical protein